MIDFLGWTLVFSVVGVTVLTYFNREIPQMPVAISSGIPGVAAGIFGVQRSH